MGYWQVCNKHAQSILLTIVAALSFLSFLHRSHPLQWIQALTLLVLYLLKKKKKELLILSLLYLHDTESTEETKVGFWSRSPQFLSINIALFLCGMVTLQNTHCQIRKINPNMSCIFHRMTQKVIIFWQIYKNSNVYLSLKSLSFPWFADSIIHKNIWEYMGKHIQS